MSKNFKQFSNNLMRVDVIGPEIKFFNENKLGKRHQTIVGGIFSVIVMALSVIVTIYFGLDLVIRTNPKAYQMVKFLDIVPKTVIGPANLDFAVKLNTQGEVMSEETLSYYAILKYFKNESASNPRIIATYDMRPCVFERDFKQSKDIFIDYKDDIDVNYYCVGDMHLNGTGPAVPQSDPNYITPYMDCGMESLKGDPVYFQVGVKRCVNSTENGNKCLSTEKINTYLGPESLYSVLLKNNNFDPSNYDHPVQEYASLVQGRPSPSTFSDNYLNYVNIFFNTHDGFVLDSVDEMQSYQLKDRVEIVSSNLVDNEFNPIVFQLNFDQENTPTYYERYYLRVQEVLANIGGVLKALMLIAQIVNLFFYSFKEKVSFLTNVVMRFVRFPETDDSVSKKEDRGKAKQQSISIYRFFI